MSTKLIDYLVGKTSLNESSLDISDRDFLLEGVLSGKKIDLSESEFKLLLTLRENLDFVEQNLVEAKYERVELAKQLKIGSQITFEKIKKFFGMRHKFTPDELNKLHEEKVMAMVEAADSVDDLEKLIAQLERWIKAAPAMTKMISTAKDMEQVRTHNGKIIAGTTLYNKAALKKAQSKLATAKKNEKSKK